VSEFRTLFDDANYVWLPTQVFGKWPSSIAGCGSKQTFDVAGATNELTRVQR